MLGLFGSSLQVEFLGYEYSWALSSCFGVGSFHYEKQLKDLGLDFRVWAIDFLGQGKSLDGYVFAGGLLCR
ncbi:hypothetical protein I3843_06G046100 [Carya illinoinensis]|uniref:Uncharacterized protein n=1 Tax=Carya illinoinensis TaxID=32201 RepID=A0A922EPL9_CARIL|nr:hypothetical protein I3760_06G049500 [Carya illinoinensis]KAG6707791.1 hypothetical protein I3842_06G050300 [Carya illinoinensis]KAG7974368.1 hypothetical protein I3843_06G046100 [Carya illinoinensis]